MLTPLRLKAAFEVFGIDKQRLAEAGVDCKFAVVLWKADRLKAARLVPHHRQHIAKVDIVEKLEGSWQKSCVVHMNTCTSGFSFGTISPRQNSINCSTDIVS